MPFKHPVITKLFVAIFASCFFTYTMVIKLVYFHYTEIVATEIALIH